MNINDPYTLGFISALVTLIICFFDSRYFDTKRTKIDYIKSSLYVGLVVTIVTLSIKNNIKIPTSPEILTDDPNVFN